MPTILSLLKEQHVYYVYCSTGRVCSMCSVHQHSITKLVTVIIYVLAAKKCCSITRLDQKMQFVMLQRNLRALCPMLESLSL